MNNVLSSLRDRRRQVTGLELFFVILIEGLLLAMIMAAFVAAASFLGGCTTQYEIVEHTRYVGLPIGPDLTGHLEPAPFPKDTFINGPADLPSLAAGASDLDQYKWSNAVLFHRTNLLNDWAADLFKLTSDLNARLDAIAKLDAEHQALIVDMNIKEDARVKQIIGNTVTAAKQIQ